MNTNTLRSMLVLSTLTLALAGWGCRSKKETEQAPSATSAAPAAAAPSATPAAAVAAAATAEVADEAIPATEDFEDEAFAKISDKTYKIDLEALRKEIEEQ